jgi:mitogen-activated protein kinase kinase kinase 9
MKINAVYCSGYHSFVINQKGEIFGFGLNLKGQLGVGSFDNKNKPTLVYSLLPNGNKNPRSNFFI